MPDPETHYPADVEMLSSLTSVRREAFLDYVGQLEKASDEWERKHGWRPYGKPLAQSTGLDCWLDFFEGGYSADEAVAEDVSNG